MSNQQRPNGIYEKIHFCLKPWDIRCKIAAAEPFHAVEICKMLAVFVITESVALFETADGSEYVSNPTVVADLTFGAVGAHQLFDGVC